MSLSGETLQIGRRYDVTHLALLGWTEGDGTGHAGYSLWSYFDETGRYLGPDCHGIEPIIDNEEATS